MFRRNPEHGVLSLLPQQQLHFGGPDVLLAQVRSCWNRLNDCLLSNSTFLLRADVRGTSFLPQSLLNPNLRLLLHCIVRGHASIIERLQKRLDFGCQFHNRRPFRAARNASHLALC